MKSVKVMASAAAMNSLRPKRSVNRLEFLEVGELIEGAAIGLHCGLIVARRAVAAPVHGPALSMPRRLCVVVGPFIG